MANLLCQDISIILWSLLILKPKLELNSSIALFHMHQPGDLIFLQRVMMEKLLFMNHQEIVSKDLIIPKMKKLKNSLVLHSTSLERLLSLVILIDFTSITSIQRDLNGMKFAVNKLKTITQLLHVLGSKMAQK